MPLKFAANISMLFKECINLEERYAAAAAKGFQGVECTFPYDVPIDEIASKRKASGLEHVLINSWPGNWANGDRGLAAVPGREAEFKESLEKSIAYAKALDCKRLHVMAGVHSDLCSDLMMDTTYCDNLKFAAQRLHEEGITALIEPINTRLTIPNYFMDHPDKAISVIERVAHSNLRLQLDIFHLQLINGNLTHNITKYLPYTDHIQIAQAPDRHEPSSPGEIDYRYVLELLRQLNYQSWVGLEYNPTGSTDGSLEWMFQYA